LNWRVGKLANVVLFIETENPLDLIIVDILLHSEHIRVQVLDIFYIREDESLFRIKSECYDVFDIAFAHFDSLFKFKLWSIHKLLIISDLDDNWNVKGLLQILRHNEGYSMSQMQSFS